MNSCKGQDLGYVQNLLLAERYLHHVQIRQAILNKNVPISTKSNLENQNPILSKNSKSSLLFCCVCLAMRRCLVHGFSALQWVAVRTMEKKNF